MSAEQHVTRLVNDYLHGLLEPADAGRVERHCEGCVPCAEALAAAERRLQEYRSLPPVEASEQLVKETLDRVDDHERKRRFRRTYAWSVLATVATAAAAVLFCCHVYYANLSAGVYDLKVLGQNSLLAGSTGSLRIQVLDRATGEAVEGANVVVGLRGPAADEPIQLARFTTDVHGTGQPRFIVPDWNDDRCELRVVADVPSIRGGSATHETVTQKVRVKRTWKLMLSTDKPVYQPGQEIQVRSLTLRTFDRKPGAGEDVVFSITDSKGNVIYKRQERTSKFGIAACSCLLATEVIEGPYVVLCKVGDVESRQTVEVKKYVLPKFKVEVTLDQPFYKPGQRVEGKVTAAYFFGKPVADAAVTIEVRSAEAPAEEVNNFEARTDATGNAAFTVSLPAGLPGGRPSGGMAHVTVRASVRDGTGQTQFKSVMRNLAERSIIVQLMPEGGTLVRGVPNKIYLYASYPDGRPAAQARFQVHEGIRDFAAQANELGVAVVDSTPSSVGPSRWDVTVTDRQGVESRQGFDLQCDAVNQDFLLRTDKAVYKAGDVMHLTGAGGAPGTVYVDLLKDGQTLVTTTIDLQDGKGERSLDLTPEWAGTLELCAYRFGADGAPIRKSRKLYVQPADQLRIATTMDRKEYQPGRPAKLGFSLTDASGKPAAGALSLAAVDEAVFSVTDQSPGTERTFYTLEKDLLKPVYAIYPGWAPGSWPDLPAEEVDCFHQALFAGTASSTVERGPAWSKTIARPRAKSHGDDFEKMAAFSPPHSVHSLALSSFVINAQRAASDKKQGESWLGWAWVVLGVGLAVAAIVALCLFSSQPGMDPVGESVWSGDRNADTDAVPTTPGTDSRWSLTTVAVVFGCLLVTCLAAVTMIGQNASKTFTSVGQTISMGGTRVYREAQLEAQLETPPPIPPVTTARTAPVRVRDQFPETLLWQPQLITDETGHASLDLTLADSITTWRLSASAVTSDGLLGSSQAAIKVFQPFFVDVNLPTSLTRGDEVTVPVVVYNYLAKAQTVELNLDGAHWFERLGAATQRLEMEANEVRSTTYRIRVARAGTHPLQITARGEDVGDAIQRQIEVVPDGRRIEQVATDRLKGEARQTFTIPADAVPDSSKILVKIYPGVYSQVVEGVEGMLQMPHGCFEQTSSSAYPNLLVVDYLKKSRRESPQVLAKAEQYLHVGYQRLLTFENQGGGFDWWGKGPPVIWLTAYGLMEFHDMSNVYPVDPAVIQRTRDWLLRQQASDGTWSAIGPTHGASIQGASDPKLALTCYVAWALAECGERDARVARAIDHVRENAPREKNGYVLALAANALAAWSPDDPATHDVLRKLQTLRKDRPEGQASYYPTPAGQSMTYAHGDYLTVETTALVTLAMLKTGGYAEDVDRALSFILKSKHAGGTWGTTSATVLSLKALVRGLERTAKGKTGSFTVLVNGKEAAKGEVREFDADVLRLFDLGEFTQPGRNEVVIRPEGDLAMMYQVVARHHEKWAAPAPNRPGLDLAVNYDRKELTTAEVLHARVTLRYNGTAPAHMVMIDLGVPPGFVPDPDTFDGLVRTGAVQRYSITARQITLYLNGVQPNAGLSFEYALKARFPIKAKTPASVAYEYYVPTNRTTVPPIELTVRAVN